MPCPFFYFVLKRCLLPVGLGLLQLFSSFRLPFLLFTYINTGRIFAKSFSKNSYLKVFLDVCVRLQAGRSTRYPAIIETPGKGMIILFCCLLYEQSMQHIIFFICILHAELHTIHSLLCAVCLSSMHTLTEFSLRWISKNY